MKEWFIDVEETQKYLDKEYPENRYLVEPRGYNKDTFMEEIWIFVNDVKDKWKDEDEEMSMCEIYNTSHLFRVDNYLICVYTSAKDEELNKQLKSIYFSTRFSSRGEELLIEEAFFEFYKKIDRNSPEFIKKSQEIVNKLGNLAIDLFSYRSQQTVYSNGALRCQIENVYKDIVDLKFSIEKSYKEDIEG